MFGDGRQHHVILDKLQFNQLTVVHGFSDFMCWCRNGDSKLEKNMDITKVSRLHRCLMIRSSGQETPIP